MAKKIKVTYFDNYHVNDDEYIEVYRECNDLEQDAEVSDEDLWDFIYDCQDQDWDDLFRNLKYSDFADIPCVITGTLGLWNGRPEIEPVCCNDLASAIRKCCNKMDYIIIEQINGHLELQGIHHDGINHFEIHLLNERGIHASDLIEWGIGKANLNNRCYHKAMNDYLF